MDDQTLSGIVERVTFHSEESGFAVLKVNIKGQKKLLCIVGNLPSIKVGELVTATGAFVQSPQHGLQFKASLLKVTLPTTLLGIEKYLASGVIKGIGPAYARKLVACFKEQIFTILEQYPERLTTEGGLSEKLSKQIVAGWQKTKNTQELMIFLQEHGLGSARAMAIYQKYGSQAIEKIKANPYDLTLDIRNIGFKIADELAKNLGIPKDSQLRARAGLRYCIEQACTQGDCAILQEELLHQANQLLDIPQTVLKAALMQERQAKHLIADTKNDAVVIYPKALYHAEKSVALHLMRIHKEALPWGFIDPHKALPWLASTGIHLSISQKEALSVALTSKITIITGGPGVGKTTLVDSFIKILCAKKLKVALCAPTGRAAKRLQETTHLPATTIHRLLSLNPETYQFKYHQDNPLPLDVLIVDEMSMVDIILFHRLIIAIPSHAALILVGDIDQLPAIKSGAVLADLIHSKVFAVVTLREIFRQAANSYIITNAHRINQGLMPKTLESKQTDFLVFYKEGPAGIHQELLKLVLYDLPHAYGCNPMFDIQVLTPMHKGELGTLNLNKDLQHYLNGQTNAMSIQKFGSTYIKGDRVIQTVNNYTKEVFNGDIGYIEYISSTDQQLIINFEGRRIPYAFEELQEINLAYAISIHKSQGSEFSIVIMPVAMQHYKLLARNLLYTGITRGKKLVILVGEKKAIYMAIQNNHLKSRLTKLADRILEN